MPPQSPEQYAPPPPEAHEATNAQQLLVVEQLSQTESLDPAIRMVAVDPMQMDEAQRQEAYDAAQKISREAGLQNKVIVQAPDGTSRWGTEYPKAFTFTGTMRGNFDYIPKNPQDRDGAMQIGSWDDFGNTKTHVIVETDDGEQYMIERTNPDVMSAAKQEFAITSTTQERKSAEKGEEQARREIDTSFLADAVLVPGEQMVLGGTTDKPLKTRGLITKITAFGMDDKGEVDPRHSALNKPEMQSTAVGDFHEALRDAREKAATKVGGLAIRSEIEVVENNDAPEVELVDNTEKQDNPYEKFTAEQLERIQENIAGSMLDALRRYDVDEVFRTATNLVEVQRTKNPNKQAEQDDSMVINPIKLDESTVRTIVDELTKLDGSSEIIFAMRNLFESSLDQQGSLTKEQQVSVQNLFDEIGNQLSGINLEQQNPYSSMSNEALAKLVDTTKATITDLASRGEDTAKYKKMLSQVGAVINSRS